jgi:hypothetical protein
MEYSTVQQLQKKAFKKLPNRAGSVNIVSFFFVFVCMGNKAIQTNKQTETPYRLN